MKTQVMIVTVALAMLTLGASTAWSQGGALQLIGQTSRSTSSLAARLASSSRVGETTFSLMSIPFASRPGAMEAKGMLARGYDLMTESDMTFFLNDLPHVTLSKLGVDAGIHDAIRPQAIQSPKFENLLNDHRAETALVDAGWLGRRQQMGRDMARPFPRTTPRMRLERTPAHHDAVVRFFELKKYPHKFQYAEREAVLRAVRELPDSVKREVLAICRDGNVQVATEWMSEIRILPDVADIEMQLGKAWSATQEEGLRVLNILLARVRRGLSRSTWRSETGRLTLREGYTLSPEKHAELDAVVTALEKGVNQRKLFKVSAKEKAGLDFSVKPLFSRAAIPGEKPVRQIALLSEELSSLRVLLVKTAP